jgi:hypothetical protein
VLRLEDLHRVVPHTLALRAYRQRCLWLLVFRCKFIDGHSEFVPETGKRRPKLRVELPGNPILGNGKSDNQNHAIIFDRDEYLQLIDANQDHYLEECLKIRNMLGEFEEFQTSETSPYAWWDARVHLLGEHCYSR